MLTFSHKGIREAMRQHKSFLKRSYLNLSNKIPLELVDLIRSVAETMQQHNIDCFILGATARDVIFHYYYGVKATRLTKDIDWGIAVSSWDQYSKLKDSLVATKLFSTISTPHRLIHKTGIPIDLLPFGVIATEECIAWSPDFSIEMNILGYQEAYLSALDIIVSENPLLQIKFASPVGLALLKIIAWNENPEVRKKDAEDLAYIVSEYLELDNRERLVLQHEDIITENDSYTDLHWSARLLGRDIKKIVDERTKKQLVVILRNETSADQTARLASHMTGYSQVSYEQAQTILIEILKGIEENAK